MIIRIPVIGNRYSTGQKRCQICEIFIKWDGLWCPCCSLYAKNEAAQLKIRIEIKSEKEDSGISIIITTTKKDNESRRVGSPRQFYQIYSIIVPCTTLNNTEIYLRPTLLDLFYYYPRND